MTSWQEEALQKERLKIAQKALEKGLAGVYYEVI